MNQDDYGYDIARFEQNPMLDQFVCPICTYVAKDPQECV